MLSCNGSLERREEGMRSQRFWRRSSLFRKLQAQRRLGEVINIVPSIGTARRGRSCRIDGCLWAVEKSSAWCCCTFGAKTNVIGFGFGGTQVAVAQEDNWIIYTVSENWPSISTIEGVVGAAHLDSRLSYRFALTCSGQQSHPLHLSLPTQLRWSCLALDPRL